MRKLVLTPRATRSTSHFMSVEYQASKASSSVQHLSEARTSAISQWLRKLLELYMMRHCAELLRYLFATQNRPSTARSSSTRLRMRYPSYHSNGSGIPCTHASVCSTTNTLYQARVSLRHRTQRNLSSSIRSTTLEHDRHRRERFPVDQKSLAMRGLNDSASFSSVEISRGRKQHLKEQILSRRVQRSSQHLDHDPYRTCRPTFRLASSPSPHNKTNLLVPVPNKKKSSRRTTVLQTAAIRRAKVTSTMTPCSQSTKLSLLPLRPHLRLNQRLKTQSTPPSPPSSPANAAQPPAPHPPPPTSNPPTSPANTAPSAAHPQTAQLPSRAKPHSSNALPLLYHPDASALSKTKNLQISSTNSSPTNPVKC